MNPWLVRAGAAVGAGALAVAVRQLTRRGSPHVPRACDDLFGAGPTIMGHRGAAAVAPENTMAAFSVAARLGVPFELDVRQCKTGEVVVVHDDTLDRTTNGRGPVRATTWSTLRALDAGEHFAPSFSGQRVPALDTVLATLGGEVVINIELKADGPDADPTPLAEAVVALIQAHELAGQVMVSAFDPGLLAAVRRLAPDVRRGQIVAPAAAWALGPRLERTADAQPDLLMVAEAVARPRFVARMQQRGYRVFVWTVNDLEVARRLLAEGADGIITDDPGRMIRDLRP